MLTGIRGTPADGTALLSERVAGHVSLDFVNTVSWDVSGLHSERLLRYRDLVRWAREAGLVSRERSALLLETAEREQDKAERELTHALQIRRVLHDVFHAVADHQQPAPSDVDALSTEAARAYGHSRFVSRDGQLVREWTTDASDLRQVLRPVVAAASELLLSDRVDRLRECANPHCRWLFLDESRNGMRRWCDMRVCGSRAKARRYYERHLAKGETDGRHSSA